MIPKQTTPLAKAIRTLEGKLVVAADVAVATVAAVDPSVLPAKFAGALVAAQHIALLAQRGVIKAAASKTINAVIDSGDPLGAILKDVEAATGGVPADVAPVTTVTP
jgi:hypothetical protein